MGEPRTLGDVAELVRSKNAGPFWMTLDMFFATDSDYEVVAAPGTIEPRHIADSLTRMLAWWDRWIR